MIVRDNQGNIIGELNVGYSNDGKQVSTNTLYSNGRVVAQTVTVRDNQGHVETKNVLGSKILP